MNTDILLTIEGLLAYSPIIIAIFAATAGMLGIAIQRHYLLSAVLTMVGLGVALIATLWVSASIPAQVVTPLFIVDSYAEFYMALILVTTIVCVIFAYAYMESYAGNREELYLLLMLSAAGGMTLVTANHLAGLFIGLEVLSIPMYGLVAYSFQRSRSLETGIKYLVLSAISTSFFIFGMALLYADTGQLTYAGIQQVLAARPTISLLIWTGLAMMLVTFAFKLSLVPFHLWTADVYEGAPVPVTAFLATVGKIAVVAALLRFLHSIPALDTAGVRTLLAIISILSILGGNLLALMQTNIKRLLGFSSIAHLGYLLIVFIAYREAQPHTITVYMVAYTLTTLAAFGVVAHTSSAYGASDIDQLDSYKGLFWQQPYPAVVLSIALLSLAGIPSTVGFIGKFYIILLGVNDNLWWLLGALAIGTVLGLFYYLRVLVNLYLMKNVSDNQASIGSGSAIGSIVLIITGILMLLLGTYPQPLLDVAAMAMKFGQ